MWTLGRGTTTMAMVMAGKAETVLHFVVWDRACPLCVSLPGIFLRKAWWSCW